MVKSCCLLSWTSCKDLAVTPFSKLHFISWKCSHLMANLPCHLKIIDSPIFLLFFPHCKCVYSLHIYVCMLACLEAYLCVCRYPSCRWACMCMAETDFHNHSWSLLFHLIHQDKVTQPISKLADTASLASQPALGNYSSCLLSAFVWILGIWTQLLTLVHKQLVL